MKLRGSIVTATSILTLTLTIVTALIIGGLWAFSIIRIYDEKLQETEGAFISRNKEIMEGQVERIIQYADRRKASTEKTLRESIRNRTYEAVAIAQNIYDVNAGKISNQRIKTLIKDALRPIRFNNSRGYFFAVSMNGYEELYPVFPEFEGQYVMELRDDKGKYVIKEEIQVVKEHGEGYIEDNWKKPGHKDGLIYPKISFVKYFKPLDWYIGTGEYVDDVERDLKQNVLDEVNSIRYGTSSEQYLFVTSQEGIELANGKYPNRINSRIKGLTDKNGINIFKQEFAAIQNMQSGTFLKHGWNDMDSNRSDSEILTYVKAYKGWGWIVGTSVYTADEIKVQIQNIKDELQNELKKQILGILLVVSSLLLISVIILRHLSAMVKNTTNTFIEFFKHASKEHEEIDLADVSFDEMKILAQEANNMIRERRIAFEKIHRLSITDGMTETFNHQHILEKLEEELSNALGAVSIILLDVDDFKSINDSCGHLAGDEVLRVIAETLLNSVRAYDSVGRYGGEEFLLLLPTANLKTATEVAERIREKVSSLVFGHGIQVTLSGGVSEWQKGQTAEELVQRADDAMYRAKELGKNRIVQN